MASKEPIAVSIIVPARNEEECLGLCLQSLTTQAGVPFEIIVVDDASSDRTAEIARSFLEPDGSGSPANRDLSRVTVISAPPLPENWTGKNNAMSAGAKIAKGKWLLFTDADTVHKRGSLARAVAEAEEHGVALLSYSPEQEVRTFWEKAVMPVIFAELAATYPPSKVRDPNSPIAAANGQYLMISRDAYQEVGGHTKIASELLEDVAMAKMVKSSSRKIWFRYGGDAVRTRMYRSWSQMKEGWTKNLALLFHSAWAVACWRMSEFLLVSSLLIGAIEMQVISHLWRPSAFQLVLALIGALYFWMRIRHARFSIPASFLAFLGLPLFAHLLFRSAKLQKSGVTWKGREYRTPGTRTTTPETDIFAATLALLMTAALPFVLTILPLLIVYRSEIFHRH